MSSQLISDSKLMYYPTHLKEVRRLIPFIGKLDTKYYINDKFKKEIGEELYQNLCSLNSNFSYEFYLYCIENYKDEFIKKYFTNFYCECSENNHFVIADLFAGEGEFLSQFKDYIPLNSKQQNLYLLANEIEENRYNVIKNNTSIDESYNMPFEKLQLPKHCISLMLYNPPYGETNGIRNARHYLQMIIDKQLIYNNQNTTNFKCGSIICVLRGDDILDCAEILSKNFIIKKDSIYKTHEEEYNKYKQYILMADLRHTPLSENNIYDVRMMQENIEILKDIILNKQPEFNVSMYYVGYNGRLKYSDLPYMQLKENFKYVSNQQNYISKQDNVWKWIKDLTTLDNLSEEQITLPKDPKLGEVSLIIASGQINGTLSLDDGNAKHVVIGGVKPITKQESITKLNDKNEKVIETTTIKSTKPYLNLLVTNKGKIEMKELTSE